MITIKERIHELKDFIIIAWEEYNGDWFEVPDEFYFGSALRMIIKELAKFAEVEDK